jgi:hypothetical protein
MQQRRLRLGDVLDDYCPRERRITNHAIVAMIEDEVRQTRCTTCDADHEYKHARVPTPRRRKGDAVLDAVVDSSPRPAMVAPPVPDDDLADAPPAADAVTDDPGDVALAATADPGAPADAVLAAAAPDEAAPGGDDEGPVHRRLIRATLPRPEGQPPPQEWKEPEFTVRQPGTNGNGNGNRDQQRRPGRRGRGRRRGQQPGGGQPFRFGQDAQGPGRREADGNRAPSAGQREGVRGRGSRHGGRKRGR